MSTPTIHVTGGLGFIGSNLVRHLNARGITPYVYDRVDSEKWRNVAGLACHLREGSPRPHRPGEILIHLGADVDTTKPMTAALWENNVTEAVRRLSAPESAYHLGRAIYASSAAVYGAEEDDFTERLTGLKPLNAYAFTKLSLDQAVFGGDHARSLPECTYGLRLFNVYGPNEGYKGEMASVVHKALHGGLVSTSAHGGQRRWCLFKSHHDNVLDGQQRRDFVHVDDVCAVIEHFALGSVAAAPGLYNVGSGEARSFNELVRAIDPSMAIEYRDMPHALRDQYQYYTRADLTKLRATGYDKPFIRLEDGVRMMK